MKLKPFFYAAFVATLLVSCSTGAGTKGRSPKPQARDKKGEVQRPKTAWEKAFDTLDEANSILGDTNKK